MHDLMGKQVAINAEVVLACCAFVAAADTHAFCLALGGLPLVLGGHRCEGEPACKASGAS